MNINLPADSSISYGDITAEMANIALQQKITTRMIIHIITSGIGYSTNTYTNSIHSSVSSAVRALKASES